MVSIEKKKDEKSVALVRSDAQQSGDVYALQDVALGMGFSEIAAMGEQLVRTGFLPHHVTNGSQFAAIVLAGREMGIPTMRSVRTLRLVKGNVVEDASAQLARFKADGGRATFRHLDAQRAELWLRHPNGDEHVEVFSIEDAKRAGLTSGKGEGWQRFPAAMLRSRAITAGLKSVGWNGAPGVYGEGELDDVALSPVTQPTRHATPTRIEEPRSEPAHVEASDEAHDAASEVVNESTGEVTTLTPIEQDLEKLRACTTRAQRMAFAASLKGKYATGSGDHALLLAEFQRLQAQG